MTAPTWIPPKPPFVGTSDETSFAVLSVEFGDGYRQELADGLNSERRTLTLEFDPLSQAEAQAIKSFMAPLAGYRPFRWTPPYESAPRLWKCRSWRERPNQGGITALTLTLEQVYDHAA